MNLYEKIISDIKEAMKKKNETALSTLRMLNSSIKNKKIELGTDPSQSDIEQLVAKEIKQRKDSISQFEKGNRDDLVKKEQAEIDILNKYLPEQLTDDEISKIIKKTITELKANEMSDMGKVMGKLMPLLKGKADGSKVNKIVKKELENN